MRVLCRRTTPDDFGRNRWANISIHVLRVGDDFHFSAARVHPFPFQSTSSVRSTTAPARPGWPNGTNFNPRPPCGGRREVDGAYVSALLFQSTSSVWRTTTYSLYYGYGLKISIHVLRVEDDDTDTNTDLVVWISIHVLRVEDD